MNKKSCLFCGKSPPEVKISNEHVLPRWLGKRVSHVHENTRYWANNLNLQTGQLEPRKRLHPGSPFTMVVNKVCKTCNEGWMSLKLEDAVAVDLIGLIEGKELKLDATRIKLIATWAAKTAAVRAAMDPGLQFVVRNDCFHIRENLQPPTHWHIWVGQLPKSIDVFTRHIRAVLPTVPSVNGTTHIHATAFAIQSLFLYVLGSNNPNLHPTVRTDVFEMFGEEAMIKIWPPIIDEISWPLNSTLKYDAKFMSEISFLAAPGNMRVALLP